MAKRTARPTIDDGWLFVPAAAIAYDRLPDALDIRTSGRDEDRATSLALHARSVVESAGCRVIKIDDHTDARHPFAVQTVTGADAARTALITAGYDLAWSAA
ncbi:MAG: hypothetical protein HHJ13_00295 [Phycicoccus sp.]|nr:hypothetical protein [Phycicoccus sp.]